MSETMAQEIVIRNKQQLNQMNEHMRAALMEFCKQPRSTRSLPVVYQYLHRDDEPITEDYIKHNTVATMTDIHYDASSEQVLGTLVMTKGGVAVATNPTVIDNIMATLNFDKDATAPLSEKKLKLGALIVYNTVAKEKIDQQRLLRANIKPVPLVVNPNSQTDIFAANGELIEKFNKLAAAQMGTSG